MVAWTLVSESNQYVATNAIEDYPICLCFIVLLIFDFFFLLRFILDLHIGISFFSISYSSQAIFSNYFHLNWANFFSRQFRRILISRENPLSKQVYTLVLVGINPIKKRRMTGSGNKWRQLWFIYTSIGLLQLLTQIVSVSNLMWYVILSFTDDFN